MDRVIDLEKARNLRLSRGPFLDLPDEDDPYRWLYQVFSEGEAVAGRTGIDFGVEGAPAVTITAAQCRSFAEALIQVADHLDGTRRAHGR